MNYLQKFVLFIAILFMISFSKSERNHSSETTAKNDFWNETLSEENDDSVEEESDDDYTTHFDTYEENDSNDINLGINKLVEKVSSNEQISVKAEKKNHTINDTLNYLLSSQDFFSNSIEKLYKKALPLLLRSYAVSIEKKRFYLLILKSKKTQILTNCLV
jgi:TATA-binding protein-associated factor Taf7